MTDDSSDALVERRPLAVQRPSLRRVLCALDVNGTARGPLSVASVIAERFGASVDALYAPSPLPTFDRPVQRVRRLIKEHNARAQLESLLVPFSASLRVAPYVTRGRPSSVILSHSELHQSDLIVLGSRQRAKLSEGAGNVAAPVCSAATCAVLTVQSHTPECAMRRVLLPLADSLATTEALNWVKALSQRFAAEVQVVRLAARRSGFWQTFGMPAPASPKRPSGRRSAELAGRVMTQLSDAGVRAKLHDQALDIAGVTEFATGAGFDLVVVGLAESPGAPGDGALLLRALRQGSDVPVLSVRAQARRSLAIADHGSLGEQRHDFLEMGISA